jgi:hypothetical protein
MSEQMQQDAVDVASVALSKYNIEKVIRHSLSCASFSLFSSTYAFRRTFDDVFSRTWRLILRKNSTRNTTQLGTSREISLMIGWRWTYPLIEISFCTYIVLDHRHVIVGRNFGSYVTHETKHFIYFYLGQVAILLFKSG